MASMQMLVMYADHLHRRKRHNAWVSCISRLIVLRIVTLQPQVMRCEMCAVPRCIARGVHDARPSGTQVKRYEAHRSRVNDLSFDERAEHVASCSDDGSVVVRVAAATLHSARHACAAPACTHAPLGYHHGWVAQKTAADYRRTVLLLIRSTMLQVTGLYTDDVVRSRHRDAIAVRSPG